MYNITLVDHWSIRQNLINCPIIINLSILKITKINLSHGETKSVCILYLVFPSLYVFYIFITVGDTWWINDSKICLLFRSIFLSLPFFLFFYFFFFLFSRRSPRVFRSSADGALFFLCQTREPGIGHTFGLCYCSLCVEWYFPNDAA